MPKLPYMQFYVADFLMDMQTLDMNIRGAWITLLCLLWRTEEGAIKLTINELANLWKTDAVSAKDNLNLMIASNLFDYDFIEHHEQYVIKSRRIARDRKRLRYRAEWMREHRVNSPCIKRGKSVDHKNQNQISESNKDFKDSSSNRDLMEFDIFWKVYPRRVGKGAARKAWIKAVKNGFGTGAIIAGVHRSKKSFDWYKDGGQFIPYPATWLNQERWLDEVQGSPSPGNPATSNPTKIDPQLKKLQDVEIELIKQREWERLHPIEQLEPDDMPF